MDVLIKQKKNIKQINGNIIDARMKYRLFLIIATFAVLGSTITSCSLDDELRVAPNDGDPKTPISFNVNIGSLPEVEVSTRGASKDATKAGYIFVSGDKVCVAVKGDGTSSNRSTTEDPKLYYVAAGDAGTTGSAKGLSYAGAVATDAFNWLSKTETVYMRAWCWGTSDTTTDDPDGAVFSIETSTGVSTQSGASVKELLYSPSTSYTWTDANSNGIPDDVVIPLHHQMARIVVNVSSTITTGVTVTGVQIGHTSYPIPLSGKYTKPSSGNYGSWDVTTPAPTTGVINAKAETAGSVYSAVVIPAGTTTYAADNKFIVITTASSGTYCYSIPTGGFNLEPGKQYTFTITNLNQIDFNVTVSAWDGGSSEPAATDLTFSN